MHRDRWKRHRAVVRYVGAVVEFGAGSAGGSGGAVCEGGLSIRQVRGPDESVPAPPGSVTERPSKLRLAAEGRRQDRLPGIAAVSCGNAKIRSQARIMIMLNGPAAIAAGPSDLRFQWVSEGTRTPDTQDHNLVL